MHVTQTMLFMISMEKSCVERGKCLTWFVAKLLIHTLVSELILEHLYFTVDQIVCFLF